MTRGVLVDADLGHADYDNDGRIDMYQTNTDRPTLLHRVNQSSTSATSSYE